LRLDPWGVIFFTIKEKAKGSEAPTFYCCIRLGKTDSSASTLSVLVRAAREHTRMESPLHI